MYLHVAAVYSCRCVTELYNYTHIFENGCRELVPNSGRLLVNESVAVVISRQRDRVCVCQL